MSWDGVALPAPPGDQRPVAVATMAMATRFEILLWGDDPGRLRAAGEEALREIRRIERQLSRFLPHSDVARINANAGREATSVDSRVVRVLAEARELATLTEGAFDVTVGPLVGLWRDAHARRTPPSAHQVDEARALVGSAGLELEVERGRACLPRPGMEVDLGAFGKGYALDVAHEVLGETGVTSAFLQGGTSSVRVLGPARGGWQVGWRVPSENDPRRIALERDAALGVSSALGQTWVAGDQTVGHVLDVRSGRGVGRECSACVVGPRAAICDALSTALVVLGREGCSLLGERFPGYQLQVV